MVDIKGFKSDNQDSKPPTGFNKKIIVFGLIFIVLMLLYYAGSMYLDYIQIMEVGEKYTSVFTTDFITELVIEVISFVVLFVAAVLSIMFIRRNFAVNNLERGAVDSKKVSILFCVLFAFVASSMVSEELSGKYLLFANSQWFGKVDPIFGKDVGYYVFQRPFLELLAKSLLSIWCVMSVLVFLIYWIIGVVFNDRKIGDLMKIRSISIHNYVNLGIFLLLLGFSYVFKAEDILYGSFSDLNGAGFTDKIVWLNYYRAFPILLVVLIIVSAKLISKNKMTDRFM